MVVVVDTDTRTKEILNISKGLYNFKTFDKLN